MVSQPIWIAIVIGVFFVGVGASYAHFASTYDPMSMKFQNQELFDKMMSNNPKMSQHWMGSDMMNPQQMMNDPQMMNTMMNDPQTMQQMHDMMMSNPQHMNQMMGSMMNDPQMQQQMMTHMMNNPEMMNTMMNDKDMMNMMGENMMMGNNMMNDQQFLNNQNDDVSEKTETSLNSQSTQVSIARGSASPGCEETNECYLPYSVTINEHSSVTWTNDDIAVHTVTSGIPSDGYNGLFDSGLISPGSTFTNQFDEKGMFDYYCIAHPWMTGKVVVLE